jgi:hypothetical protein
MFAQEKEYELWDKAEMSKYSVFKDTVYIRIAASPNSPVKDTLHLGNDVVFLKADTAELTINSVNAPWVQILYKKGTEFKQGYLWGGFLSFTPLQYGTWHFLYGIENVISKDTIVNDTTKLTFKRYGIKLKVLTANNLIASDLFFMTDSGPFTETSMQPMHNLKDVYCIPMISFGGEACGVPTLRYMYAWDGNKLHALPVLSDVVDGGEFYHFEEFIFPDSKGGADNKITWKMEEGETVGVDKKGEEIEKRKANKKTYTWDGKSLK